MNNTSSPPYRPHLFRWLAVIFYDMLILFSILFLAALIAVIINDGKAISQGNVFLVIYLVLVSGLFYCWFWTHGGQTIGMRAWKVSLRSDEHTSVSWRQAIVRFTIALISWLPLGLGFWWQYFGSKRKSWPDMVSGTYLYYHK
ncbi:MAG: RDD family protein [Gammaproteobacteria bacterium]|nr:RDD family protein [Gammaproteobacteria bacterium]